MYHYGKKGKSKKKSKSKKQQSAIAINKKKKLKGKRVLKCDAIPKVALSKKYVRKFSQGWNKWNGL